MNSKLKVWVVAVMAAAAAQASLTDFGLGGNKLYDGWDGLSASHYPGYGSYPGAGTWPGSMVANEAGSNGGELAKISGTGYAGGSSLYSSAGGVFEVSQDSVVSGLETIVFAVGYGAGTSASFTNGPTLMINGSTVVGAADSSFNLGSYDDNIGGYDVTLTTDVFQWDLSSLGETVSSFSISYDVGEHAQQYGLQLEQSDTYTEAIPEPATIVLIGGAGGALFMLRRMRIC
ncbi:PEP-CTERM sorting domain-containing protein [Pontiella agarivorans]|uniref:PEP-CTERM sorting domain-containing protein n=1 Tax=Pontiella agarivorans TaxID=3038953 RepID=A0ABU5MVB4_9BACT|nr:PEP-CTERM sorting domain-containing protein [Pontiella agarivorans]MDZ8118160.1 PEP-CTERM sorting domain-containing protein [Pontiella agarivorans]